MTALRIGIVGVAHSHVFTYANVLLQRPDAKLIGVFDPDGERGRQAAEQFATKAVADHRQLIQEVDAVLVFSENRFHMKYASDAAAAGRAVLVEKPLTTTGEDARALIDLCERQGVALQTVFPTRFNLSVNRIKQRIDAGQIGEVVAISATNHGKMPGGWFTDPELAGGGAVLDHTVHLVDIMRWMLASEVREVYAETGTLLHDIPVEDCGLLSMQFENGTIATLDTSWSRPSSYPTWGNVTMRIVGTKGVLHLDAYAQAGQMWVNEAGGAHRLAGWGEAPHAGLIDEFLDSVRQKRKPCVTGEDGLRAAEVAWSAYDSAKLRQPVPVKHY